MQMIVTEKLLYSDYVVRKEITSVFDKHATVSMVVGFRCPRCGTLTEEKGHGYQGECSKCGLHFERLGNNLYCTGDPGKTDDGVTPEKISRNEIQSRMIDTSLLRCYTRKELGKRKGWVACFKWFTRRK